MQRQRRPILLAAVRRRDRLEHGPSRLGNHVQMLHRRGHVTRRPEIHDAHVAAVRARIFPRPIIPHGAVAGQFVFEEQSAEGHEVFRSAAGQLDEAHVAGAAGVGGFALGQIAFLQDGQIKEAPVHGDDHFQTATENTAEIFF